MSYFVIWCTLRVGAGLELEYYQLQNLPHAEVMPIQLGDLFVCLFVFFPFFFQNEFISVFVILLVDFPGSACDRFLPLFEIALPGLSCLKMGWFWPVCYSPLDHQPPLWGHQLTYTLFFWGDFSGSLVILPPIPGGFDYYNPLELSPQERENQNEAIFLPLPFFMLKKKGGVVCDLFSFFPSYAFLFCELPAMHSRKP
eukprot:TRINITY_DN12725_c0_g1_i2.p1 TRINITY_DN12725_c0_g1~~TRINITY_DN12725_c0_g1_i2.p1  ORF type:complete len:198 (+),score=3.65 TRINITY_DN12725_c0_g1_i2:753-1346(+)